MTVFLLGPGRGDKGDDAPLQARLELARRMRATGTDAVVMEGTPDVEDENNFEKFRRLILEQGVTTFFLVVPLNSRLHGLSVEIGHLLTEIQAGRLPAARVHIAPQILLASIDDEGLMALKEPGNRTRYYEDLIDEGCPIHRWRNWAELNRHAAAVALEDSLRPG